MFCEIGVIIGLLEIVQHQHVTSTYFGYRWLVNMYCVV